jgi:deoxyribose-phosphate aldolase
MNISTYIDYSLLESTASERDIIDLCQEAMEHKFHAICISSCYVPLAKQLLDNSKINICTVVGFPFGSMSTPSKVFEAKQAIEDGASEIEMVINIGLLKSRNYVSVFTDISNVKNAISKTPLSVIIEISDLNKNEVIKACEICIDANVDYVKTSTGLSKGGATLTAVKIIKKTLRERVKIIASGSIHDYETAVKYLESGADRVETSSIIKETTQSTRPKRTSKIYKRYIENKKKTVDSTTPESIQKEFSA